MEVYILDSLLRRVHVVDKFESLIWTERYAEIGDFEIQLHSTRENRGLFLTGTHLALNTSWRVMVVESAEDITDSEGRALLQIKGSSLEAVMKDRAAMAALTSQEWVITNTPGEIARYVFDQICRQGIISLDDKIPFIQTGTIFPASTIPETSTSITYRFEPKSVYEVIKDICDTYDLGFRLVRNFDTSQLYFDIYSGNDRTTRQTTSEAVIFAIENDNLQNTKEFSTIQGSKNVAYVYSEFGNRVVYGDFVPTDVDGFDRRVLIVKAENIAADTVDIQGELLTQGKAALAKSRTLNAFEGELNQNSVYKYGTHYNMGDAVEMRNQDGIVTYKRVTEQIFVHDAEGERSYPTLSVNLFVSQNTWLSQIASKIWTDFTTEEWAGM